MKTRDDLGQPPESLGALQRLGFAMSEVKLNMRALSIRQPHAEAIMRGVKKVEYRSSPTKIRGRILIYASQSRYSAEAEAKMMEDYGITNVSCDDLARGVSLAQWNCSIAMAAIGTFASQNEPKHS